MVEPDGLPTGVLRHKGAPSGQKFIAQAGQGILVALWADQSFKLFGRHIEWRALAAHEARLRRFQDDGEAKVGEKNLILRAKENIFWLQIAVHHVQAMRMFQSVAKIHEYP